MSNVFSDVQPHHLRALASAVFIRAIEETKSRDPITALDACLWLASDDAAIWLDCAGMGEANPVWLLTSGRARKRTKKKGRTKDATR